jgi:hypothetical protein
MNPQAPITNTAPEDPPTTDSDSAETEAAPWFDSSGRFIVWICVGVVIVESLLAFLVKVPAYLLPVLLAMILTLQLTAFPLARTQRAKWALALTTLTVLGLTVAVAQINHDQHESAHTNCLNAVRKVPHWQQHPLHKQMRSIGLALCAEVDADHS